jgi:RNA polymerase sigma-70 factor (ECF subfamily)
VIATELSREPRTLAFTMITSAFAIQATMLRDPRETADETTSYRRAGAGVETSPDLDLVRKCADKDAAAMQELVQRYQPKLSRFISRMLNSPEDTEEAVIDVFMRVWQQAGRFEGRSSVSTWVYRIAANVAYDARHRRRTRPQTTTFEDERLPVDSAVDVEQEALTSLERDQQAALMRRAMAKLGEKDRLLLVLYYVEELAYDEISGIAGCSYPVLKTRLMRARQRLRTVLESLEPEAAS